jgi:threonine dehydrogenase-like Zn-dependent dehydrogenase
VRSVPADGPRGTRTERDWHRVERIENGEIDPSFVVKPLEESAQGYETFKHKQDECVKVVPKP